MNAEENDENKISIQTSTGSWITLLARAMEAEFESRLAQYGITRASAAVLSAVHFDDIDTPAALATFIGIDGAAITRHLDRIEKQGFIRRTQNPNDRRSIILKLTSKGERLAPKVTKESNATNAKFTTNLTASENTDIQNLVRKMLLNSDSKPTDI